MTILIIGLGLALAFGGLGVLLIILAQVSKKKAAAAAAWPTTTGRVISAQLRDHRSYDRTDQHTEINYEAAVEYTYAVSGQEYTGNRIAFGANRFDRGTAQKKLNAFPMGSSVTVYYDPSDPTKAVLEPSAAGSKVFMIVGIVFAVIGLLTCCGGAVAALLSQS